MDLDVVELKNAAFEDLNLRRVKVNILPYKFVIAFSIDLDNELVLGIGLIVSADFLQRFELRVIDCD